MGQKLKGTLIGILIASLIWYFLLVFFNAYINMLTIPMRYFLGLS
ncbi:MAG: hypothetical protein ACTSRB_14825 [Candidatus Helarchaeota archaeon]